MLFDDPSHKEYDFWDLRLLKAAQFAEDYTRDGVPIWWDESDDVVFEAEARISRSKAATQRAEQRENDGDNKKSPPGRYFVPVPKTRGGAPFPSFQDWVEEQSHKKGRK